MTLGLVVGVLASVAPAAQAAGATRRVIISKVQQPLSSGAGGTVTSTSSPTQTTQLNCGSTCTVSYSRYASVTITATPTADVLNASGNVVTAGSTLVGFSSNCTRPTPAANTCTISSLASDTTVTVTFARKQTLAVQKSSVEGGNGSVTVTGPSGSTPGYVDCATAGCQRVSAETYNAALTLTATADATSRFMGWTSTGTAGTTGCQSYPITSPPTAACSVTMASAKAVTATFRSTYLLTASKASTGSGAGTLTSTFGGTTTTCAPTCSARYISSESVTLAASPAALSVFSGWEGDGGLCSDASTTCVVPMGSDRSITARFTSLELLTVAIDGAVGSVVSSPAGIDCPTTCSARFPFGSQVTLTASSTEATAFRGWTGVTGCETDVACVVTIAGAGQTATANFGDLNKLEVLQTLTDSTAVGTITATILGSPATACATSCWQEPGTVVVLEATPGADTRWDGWSGDCVLSGTDDTICTVTLATSETVTASFVALHDLDLTVVEDGVYGGTVSVLVGDTTCVADASTSCDATYDHGTSVTLVAAPDTDTSVLWTGDIGGCAPTAKTCVVPMDAAAAITATFARTLFPLSVTVSGSGSGSVTGVVGEVSVFGACTAATCTEDIGIGDTVALTAIADDGSRFAGWSGDCTGTGACTVTMSDARSVTATFTDTSVLSIAVTESGGTGKVTLSAGTVTSASECSTTCSVTYDATDVVLLTAVPTMTLGSESKVGTWTGACAFRGSLSTCSVTMSAAQDVGITFVPLTFTLTATRTLLGTGTGTITSDIAGIACPADCTENYAIRTQVILTATAGTNTQFMGWSGGTCTGTSTTCLASMDAARTVTATFASLETLTVTKNGPRTGTVSTFDGQISCAGDCIAADTGVYPYGTTVTVSAVPDGTSVVGGWSQNSCRTSGSCAVTVNGATTLTVTFNPPSFSLSVARTGTGSGSVTSTSNPTQATQINCGSACSVSYFENTVVTLTAAPSSSSYFDSWTGACTGQATTCQVTMSEARSVTANFGVPSLTLEKVRWASGNGSMTVSTGKKGGQPFSCGTSCTAPVSNTYSPNQVVTITVAAASGSRFGGWGGACADVPVTTLTCTVTMDRAKTVVANFGTLVPVGVTVLGSGSVSMTTLDGTVTCSADCTYSVVAGWSATFVATPGTGYTFANWDGECAGQFSTTCTLPPLTSTASVLAVFRPPAA